MRPEDTMSIHTLTKAMPNDGGHSLLQKTMRLLSRLSEPFWFCLSFLLFLLMGPFSAVAVVIGLCTLARENKDTMIEPASV